MLFFILISSERNFYLDKVFENSSLFTVRNFSPSTIDFGVLTNSDLLVLNNLETIPDGVIGQLSGSIPIVIFPAEIIDYTNKQNSNLKNNMLKSYDLYLNSRYNVTLNQKTIERVKNFFQ